MEAIAPGETLESYFGRNSKQNKLSNKPLNNFILKNYGLGENKYPEKHQEDTNPFKEQEQIQQKFQKLNKLTIHDKEFQEGIHKYLLFKVKEQKEESKAFRQKAHFPLRFTPNLKSKSKWQVRWHPKAAPLVKYAYQIFYGSINPVNPSFNPKLREALQLSNQCLVCRLTNKEWKHPKGIITTGNQGGRCSAKIADPLVPQSAPNVVNLAETFGTETETIQFLKSSPTTTLPLRATTGSAAYDLFPLETVSIPPHTRQVVSTGLSCEMPSTHYGQIMPRSGISSKLMVDVIPGVLDSDYRGIIGVILHNNSDKQITLHPGQAMAQILFLQLGQLPISESSALTKSEKGTGGFGSTDNDTFASEVITLEPIKGRPPGTTFLGAQPSKATVRLNSPTGPSTQIVIDSGSNITLVSSKLLEKMNPSPKSKEGQNIKINQVTGRSSTTQYVTLNIYFDTKPKSITLKLEAYIVKDMNAPLILGNDFADQYSLSIIRNNGATSLKLGDSGFTIPLDSSVDSAFLDVKALRAEAMAAQHRRNNCQRRHNRGPTQVMIRESTLLSPWTIKKVAIRLTKPLERQGIFIPHTKNPSKFQNATFIDSIITNRADCLHVTNDTDTPVHLDPSDSIGTIENEDYYDQEPSLDFDQLQVFFNFVNSVLKAREPEILEPEEQAYEDQQPDTSFGPKLAEVPDPQEIPSQELLSSLNFNPKLSATQRIKLEQVIKRNSKAFSLDGRIGDYSDIKYKINLKEGVEPVSMPPYHASPEKRKDIDKQIDKWFSQGVIQELESPWGAPVIVVYHNGKARVCIDYRRVNAVTEAAEYPLPRQSDILRTLSGSQWLSTFDALSGFHQLEIVKEHRHITAFRTHKKGLLEFTRLPFGLRNGPAVFQRVMNKVLAKFLWLFVLVYINDIVVYSQSFKNHLQHLNSVLGAIAKANITLSPPKCHIGYQSLILLGQRVSRLGISTHQEKIDTVDAMKPPTKIKELQMFLGFVNYFAIYIPFYTWITRPLYRLLSKDVEWEWTPIHQEAFDLCKLALKSTPILGHPMDGRGYRLYTDASDFGIGAVLQQIQPIKIGNLKGTQLYE